MSTPETYGNWSREDLIARLVLLENRTLPKIKPGSSKLWQPRSFPRRKIALKFCYSGWEYGGLAIQPEGTPLPTVEGELYNALGKARLIDPDAGLEGCAWQRCGRTDRGVSAAGQVVSLWIRSALLPYVRMLNRILPLTIRVLAWSPVAPDFSARFSCASRYYKYFFHPDALDVDAMQDACKRLLGTHDFRNLHKHDPAKQLTAFERTILRAEVVPVESSDGYPHQVDARTGMWVLNLEGTAFLYHQVRHIMAVLLLVGAGLEPPSVVSALMNTAPGAEPGCDTIHACKPPYQMADGLPLMLWDCVYPPGTVSWQLDEIAPGEPASSYSTQYEIMKSILRQAQVYAALDAHFLRAARIVGHVPPPSVPRSATTPEGLAPESIAVPFGGGVYRRIEAAKYVPLLQRPPLEHVEVVNERWRERKGLTGRVPVEADDE
ncbi:pseudouridine synthase [Fistulina hepatica ATCC 64428]|uniref:tRNA pseudouridine synthase n=1 Tax=Fistulina hepatica ATCC 64428 TaxID=1128425 RepID=A0A0D7ADQ6_9AGAR|nr:pseudouridine synthase [Fistulina hepatica ATCC 64428]